MLNSLTVHYLIIPLTQWRDKLLSHGKRLIEEPAYSRYLDQSGKLATKISKGKQPLALTWKTNVTLPRAIVISNVESGTDSDVEVLDVQKATHASGFRAVTIPHPIQWLNVDYSESMPRDDHLLSDLSRILNSFQRTPAALTARSGGHMVLGFDHTDMRRLLGPTQILNNICINKCSRILQTLFTSSHTTASQCAILSSFDLTRIRGRMPMAEIWRNNEKSGYWNKTKWILPIHRPSETHWVLAVIEVPERKVLVFDSFGSSYQDWSLDLQVSQIIS